jgi:hypothetical protein
MFPFQISGAASMSSQKEKAAQVERPGFDLSKTAKKLRKIACHRPLAHTTTHAATHGHGHGGENRIGAETVH